MFSKEALRADRLIERLVIQGKSVATNPEFSEQDAEKIRSAIRLAVLDLDPEVLARKDESNNTVVIKNCIEKAAAAAAEEFPSVFSEALSKIIEEMYDEVLGYGPVQPYLRDPDITEIIVMGPGRGKILYEKNNEFHVAGTYYKTAGSLKETIDRIISPLNRRINESNPMVDARLPDGSRVNAVVPPIAADGPYLTIRKFRKNMTVEELLRRGTFTEQDLEFLSACVRARVNLLVSGGTGTGKTTLLNALSSFIPHGEMVVTVEDTLELQFDHPYVRRLEARPPNIEGKGEVSIWMLVKNALRMRVHRIIVGEVRGGEALDMLRAMNTGHDGSMSTIHANSPQEAFEAMVVMILLSGMEIPVDAIRRQIASGLDIVVQAQMFPNGDRRIVQVTEVVGYDKGEVLSRDLLVYDHDRGCLVPTGVVPGRRILEKFRTRGIRMPELVA